MLKYFFLRKFFDIVTEYGILDRELDLNQWDDTAMSAVIVSGVSQGPGVAYGGLINYGKTKKFEQEINKLIWQIYCQRKKSI